MSRKTTKNSRCYKVTMTVYVDAEADRSDIINLVRDLEWAGGAYSPDDPRFYCLDVKNLKVRRAPAKDRK